MMTKVDLPAELVTALEFRAVQQGRGVQEVIADLLVAGLNPESKPGAENLPVVAKHLPLIKVRPAPPADARQLTTQEWCDWLKEVELQLEVERHEKALGHQHLDRVDP